MNEMLKTVLSLSLSGTLLILLLFSLRSLFKERLSKRWQYYIWLVVVARLLVPFAPETNLMTMFFQGIDRTTEQREVVSPYGQQSGITDSFKAGGAAVGQNNLHGESTEPAKPVNRPVIDMVTAIWQNLWIGWLVAALILFIRKITIYQDFVKYIRAGCAEVADIDLLERFGKLVERNRVNTTVELYTNNLISSPLLIGFFRPCIVLPTVDLSPADFDYTILHELMHFKRRDMFYKWLVQFTVCVHWFNPFVYLMSRETGRACELSCDEAVIGELDAQGRQAYGGTLLNAIGFGGSYKDSLASLTLNESKELLKERLDSIMNFKKRTKWGIVITLLLTVVLICGFTFSGAYAANGRHQTKPDDGTDTVSLHTSSEEIVGFQPDEQTTAKEIVLNAIEDEVKIQLNTVADGDSHRALYAQMYDYYRTYEQTKADIQNGYIVNTGVSFSERAMPIVTGGRGTGFYVNHDNSINISITLKNLIDGSGHHYWKPITDVSFVSFEVYDPAGKVAYSFHKEGAEIQDAVDIDTELAVYPGEWRYKIAFAYVTNGSDPSDMKIALKYKTIFEDDIQWLADNKLNKTG